MIGRHVATPIALVWLVVLFVVPLPLVLTLAAGLPAVYLPSIMAIQCGVIAYSWMLAAVALSTRPRWLDRLVGLPHLYMIHGCIGLLAIVMAFLHRQLSASYDWLVRTTGNTAFVLFVAVACWSLVFMAGWLTSRVPALARLKRFLEPVFRHEFSVWLHRLNLVAVGLIFIHVQLISYIRAVTPFMVVFYVMTALTAVAYTSGKIGMRTARRQGRVTGVTVLNPQAAQSPINPPIIQLTVKLPASRAARWQVGDFAFIRFPEVQGMREYHPFSIVNTPDEGLDARAGMATMMFAIRADGDFTARVASLRAGDRVDALPPYGRYQRFIEEHDASAPLVLIAGGIGVTPLLPVLRRYGGRVRVFIYTAKRGQLLLDPAKTRAQLKTSGARGVIGEHRVRARDMKLGLVPNALYLIAGPASMQRSWRVYLRRHGTPADSVYYEPFTW